MFYSRRTSFKAITNTVGNGFISLLILAAGLGYSLSVQAGPIATYEIQLKVDSVIEDSGPCLPSGDGRFYFGCIEVGDIFKGSFSVDSDILAVDGLNNTAPLISFRLPFGNAFYSIDADNLTLSAFRNPILNASAPGFIIEGGEVVDFLGDVYGDGDVPFIDFFFDPYHNPDDPTPIDPTFHRNTFFAHDFTTRVDGSLLITRVPEPGTLYLMLWLVLGLYLTRRQLRPMA